MNNYIPVAENLYSARAQNLAIMQPGVLATLMGG
jgi:hypothetical protein